MSSDALREQLVDALVMSPMSDYVGTQLNDISRTADALLPLIRRAQTKAWDQGFDKGSSHGIAFQAGDDSSLPALPGLNPYREDR